MRLFSGTLWTVLGVRFRNVELVTVCSVSYAMAIVQFAQSGAVTTVRGRAGTLRGMQSHWEAGLQPVLDAIESIVPEDGSLFTLGSPVIVNFWTLRENPTRFNWLYQPPYHTEEQAKEVVATLEQRGDTHVLIFPPVRPGNIVGEYVVSNYRVVWQGSTAVLFAPPATSESPE